MSRLAQQFALLRKQHRSALVPYIMAGDPEPWITVPLMHGLVRAGANIIELGIPFSDPMADGPTIQRAAERALRHRVNIRRVLEIVREFRTKDPATPIVLMGYLNPIEVMGYEVFAEQAAAAGADGIITVDVPPEEAGALIQAFKARRLDPIFLAAPTSGPERLRTIAQAGSGFIYYVSLRGVTGAAHLDVVEVRQKINTIRRLTELPLGVGFGINGPEVAAEVARFADAVVVGSALVRRMEQNATQPERILSEVPSFLGSLRLAMDRATDTRMAGATR